MTPELDALCERQLTRVQGSGALALFDAVPALREALPRVLAEDLWRLRQPYPVTLGAAPADGIESLRLVVQVDEWLARSDGAGLALKLRARWRRASA